MSPIGLKEALVIFQDRVTSIMATPHVQDSEKYDRALVYNVGLALGAEIQNLDARLSVIEKMAGKIPEYIPAHDPNVAAVPVVHPVSEPDAGSVQPAVEIYTPENPPPPANEMAGTRVPGDGE